MGGPWRERGYDPAAWRPPQPIDRVANHPDEWGSTPDRVTSFVLGYVAATAAVVTIMLAALRSGW